MCVGPHDLFGVVQVVDHGLPFFQAVVINHRFFLFFCLQMQAHTYGIGFGMKLGADHAIIEADGHHRSFEGNMRPFFFNG